MNGDIIERFEILSNNFSKETMKKCIGLVKSINYSSGEIIYEFG